VVKRIAIILARGGSKRLPRKNLLDFHGKPMLAWSVEAALSSGQYQRVLVSTDDEEIARVGRAFGAQVPFLRNAAADDVATSSQATLVALKQAEQFWGEEYDAVSQLMANCPMRSSDDIRDAVSNFDEQCAESQLSCFGFGWMNPWWAIRLGEGGQPRPIFPDALTARSQDMPQLYCPSGALWIARTSILKREGTFYTPQHTLHPMHWVSAMDIDDAEDLEMAKACYLVKKNGNRI
jgi:CMP-N-acetylneuraminic acid synthetase